MPTDDQQAIQTLASGAADEALQDSVRRRRLVRHVNPEGCVYSDSCRNSVVLVDQPAEPGNTDNLTISACTS